MLESIDERCRVGSSVVEQRDLSDPIQQLLSKENFNDVQDYVFNEAVLVKDFPEASTKQIKVEKDLQSSYYVLQKFLELEKQLREALISGDLALVDSEACGTDIELHMAEDSFYKFICSLCLKLMQKCVTTVCGHLYCESCLENYLMFKEKWLKCDFAGTKQVVLREKPLHSSYKVDDVIAQLVDNCANKQIKADWQQR